MWRAVLRLFVILPLPTYQLVAACPCMIQFGVCDEARQSDAVFIGSVESVAPQFLDPYARAKAMLSLPAAETARLQADSSPQAFARLKSIYLELFKGMPDFTRAQIMEATTQRELQNAFESVQSEGRVAKFHVTTRYKYDDDAPEVVNIWTGSGDCGIDFQVGETYLVYAIEDEDSGKLETSACMRTRRLTEEKGDLAFLYFLDNSPKESTRLEGFVSTSFSDQNIPRYENSVSSPAQASIVELATGGNLRYTQSDSTGRFSFDGLKAGDYRLSLLAPGFPRAPRTVLTSRAFHANEASCARQILILPAHTETPLSQ